MSSVCLFHFKFSSFLNSLQNSIPVAERPRLLLYSKIHTSVYLKFKHEFKIKGTVKNWD